MPFLRLPPYQVKQELSNMSSVQCERFRAASPGATFSARLPQPQSRRSVVACSSVQQGGYVSLSLRYLRSDGGAFFFPVCLASQVGASIDWCFNQFKDRDITILATISLPESQTSSSYVEHP
jgi:hypothetical protein